MNIGFIGLGRMGRPMALHLINPGHQAFVQTRGGLQGNTGRRNTLVHRRSISPMATKAVALKVNTLGAADIDAPVSGAAVGAKAAPLAIRCGGDQAVFDAVLPLLQLMGKNITLAGGNGDSQTTKVAVHGERMIKRMFAPGLRIKLHQKDLNLALHGAGELGVALPQTANAAPLMQACAANGMADPDHAAPVKALGLMAGHAVAKCRTPAQLCTYQPA